jgi:putative DNA primase/helicase
MDAGLIKKLTGRDAITARDLYERSFTYQPQFKIWLAANDPPILPDTDDAIWRRIIEIPFVYVVPPEKRDPNFKTLLATDARIRSAILNWLIAGCIKWQQVGMVTPETVKKATETLRRKMDPTEKFFEERCELREDHPYPCGQLYREYTFWCDQNGLEHREILTQEKFSKRMQTRGLYHKKVYINKVQMTCWIGVAPRSDEPQPAGATQGAGQQLKFAEPPADFPEAGPATDEELERQAPRRRAA